MPWTHLNALLLTIGTVIVFKLRMAETFVAREGVATPDNSSEVVQGTFAYTAEADPTTPASTPAGATASLNSSSSSSGPGGQMIVTSSSSSSSNTSDVQEPDSLNSIDSSFLVMNYTMQNQLRIEAIKRDILNRLGMTQVPDVSRLNMTVRERRTILRLYRKSIEELHGKSASSILFDDDQFYANRFNSFTENGDKPPTVSDELWRSLTVKRIYFSVDIPEPADARKETIVKSATLKLFKRNVRPQNLVPTDNVDRAVRIDVHQILESPSSVGGGGGARLLRRSVSSRLVSLDKAGWEEFDLSRAVQDWIRDPSSNLGIEISCDVRYRMENLLEFVTWSPDVADSAYLSSLLPVLNVLTHERGILGRQKRTTTTERSDCVRGDGEQRCCRFPLVIRFRDIGWEDWVIEPASYQAYFCEGTCPPNYRVAHRFARVKALLRERLPNSSLTVSCSATRMGSLNIAHYNNEGILIVSVMENMFPLECKCA